ncbi:hypothetical protein [Desulfocurvibacter africanus]|uniref:Uncharacterized protein n=1 Tax=Desulfocurvibacter africanus subsp. africanus str. Walvis Bay TaxID=690850 RepID=F3YVZ4_DESAF|nr:hypothetical protein [Desulfocurvibacter africanus]EGJ49024.1 hypothetical protein Desaf_0672 [Desulfocurvibacter africanus subsp. africanus str. Walvis Bay]
MRPKRIRDRDPQELHAELASQVNRLARVRSRDNRCAYLKAARREAEAARNLARYNPGDWS